MKILLGVSNRHVHLSKDDYKILFDKDELTNIRDLVQPHQYVSDLFVDIRTPKNLIKKVRVLGPLRDYTQVEISKTDSYFLGLNPPVASSGELENASEIEIIGPCGSIVRKSAIIADRHIHITQKQKEELGFKDIEEVSVLFETEKSTIFSNVKLKVCDEANLEMHLDIDDANGALLKTGDYGTIVILTKPQNY
ncbi:MAG: hypothetical protein J6A17_01550 [Bacilli bacterium]|nr:hypothetical protein [Bacilli bacterium]